LLCFDM